ncbi:MAG: hypothetical protein QXP36_10800 [Conexivisphaerales archaeon]
MESKVFLRNLKSDRIDSYLNVPNGFKKYEYIQEMKLLRAIPGIRLISALLKYSEI